MRVGAVKGPNPRPPPTWLRCVFRYEQAVHGLLVSSVPVRRGCRWHFERSILASRCASSMASERILHGVTRGSRLRSLRKDSLRVLAAESARAYRGPGATVRGMDQPVRQTAGAWRTALVFRHNVIPVGQSRGCSLRRPFSTATLARGRVLQTLREPASLSRSMGDGRRRGRHEFKMREPIAAAERKWILPWSASIQTLCLG